MSNTKDGFSFPLKCTHFERETNLQRNRGRIRNAFVRTHTCIHTYIYIVVHINPWGNVNVKRDWFIATVANWNLFLFAWNLAVLTNARFANKPRNRFPRSSIYKTTKLVTSNNRLPCSIYNKWYSVFSNRASNLIKSSVQQVGKKFIFIQFWKITIYLVEIVADNGGG